MFQNMDVQAIYGKGLVRGPHMQKGTVSGTRKSLNYSVIFMITYTQNLQTWPCAA